MARVSFCFFLVVICSLSACDNTVVEDAASTRLASSGSENENEMVGLRLNTLLGGVEQDFKRAEMPREFRFPQDHLAHPGFRTEWWYLTAFAEDEQGREYGVQYTLFRQALTPEAFGIGPWQTGTAYLAHVAVTDVTRETHHHAQRFARGHPSLAGVSAHPPLRLWIEDWQLNQVDELRGGVGPESEFALHLQAKDGDMELDLTMVQAHPIVLQGEEGLSRKGPGSASFYYSMPRMRLEGTLILDEETLNVRGLAWLDREWSTSVLPETVQGWDWFSLQLDDGTSAMAFRLRREDGQRDAYDHGMWLAADLANERGIVGSGDAGALYLSTEQFCLTPTRYFTDDQNISWPVAWRMRVRRPDSLGFRGASAETVYHIEALVDDQVMNTAIVYWEGLVAVRDEDGNRLGRGYMELTGYEEQGKE